MALFAVSSLAAMAVGRISAGLHADVPPGWPANGCLRAVVTQMDVRVVGGEGRLCIADGRIRGTLDVDHVDPWARYAEWIAYFESPRLCSFGALTYQANNFAQPCTLSDLDGAHPQGVAREVAESAADAEGSLHVEGLLPEIDMRSNAQAWLLVSRPSWSPRPRGTSGPAQDAASKPVGRAVFNVP